MRIKFLAVIASFVCLSVTLGSCLGSDTTYETSSDATVYAFGLDTVYGKHYTFTIDQINRVIYNRDSLPVGADTIIDRILIDTFSVSGWITAGLQDTLFNMSDSVDFTGIVNTASGMKFTVHAPDGSQAVYTVQVNRHTQDPDSLMWQEVNALPVTATAEQKAMNIGDAVWVFTSYTTAYKTSTAIYNGQWGTVALSGLPDNTILSTMVALPKDGTEGEWYYVIAGDINNDASSNKVYRSEDGQNWTEMPSLAGSVIALIAACNNEDYYTTSVLTGILMENGTAGFNISKDGENWNETTADNPVPENFPLKQLSSASFVSSNNLKQTIAVGSPVNSNEELTRTWFSMNGYEWVDMTNTNYSSWCPAMTSPFIMNYGDNFYIFGGKMDAIYESITGISWKQTEKKFLLPETFESLAKAPYSIAIDNNHYIWVVFGGDGTTNSVWRGRLNKLGFLIQ